MTTKKCVACGSSQVKKYGKVRGRQRFQCLYYGRTVQWVQRQLDAAPISSVPDLPQRIIAVTDTTFFGRGYGVLVVRCPRLKKNVHVHELQLETPAEYHAARASLETQGFIIEAAVIDGKRGVLAVFPDIPVQFCQFHQIAIVRRYLTSRPKLPAGRELRAMALALPTIAEQTFTNLLAIWHKRWEQFLKERTYTPTQPSFSIHPSPYSICVPKSKNEYSISVYLSKISASAYPEHH